MPPLVDEDWKVRKLYVSWLSVLNSCPYGRARVRITKPLSYIVSWILNLTMKNSNTQDVSFIRHIIFINNSINMVLHLIRALLHRYLQILTCRGKLPLSLATVVASASKLLEDCVRLVQMLP